MRFILAFLTILFIPSMTLAGSYQVLYDQSSITFSGEHAGNPFEGAFKNWQAEITFDSDNPADATVTVTIDLTSAKTGTKLYDGTLPSDDWFDTDNTPEAKYVLKTVSKTENGYQAQGDLTLRGITQPVSFDFTLVGDNPVTMRADFPINRLDFNIGAESDPDAEWVSEEIMVELIVVAKR